MVVEERKKRQYSTPNASHKDQTLILNLDDILSSTNPDTLTTTKVQELVDFIDHGNISTVLSLWSSYSTSNEHIQVSNISVRLMRLTTQINLLSSVLLTQRQIILDTYRAILNNHSKIIYRALNNMRTSFTNPILRLLRNMINYDQIIAHEFLNAFDLTLNALPKLLVPHKSEIESGQVKERLSIRLTFIKFWIDLCSKVAYFHRLDLLSNHPKIMNNLWKYIGMDSIDCIKMIIEFVDSKILGEPNFKRAQKCKILNENFMFKTQAIFHKTEEPFFIEFMNKLATDSKEGLVFPNDKLWQKSESGGAPVQTNNKTFRIANKLLYTLLTSLKPGESNAQLQFVVRILAANQELIPPYMNWMVQQGGGYHDPSLTSWWISHSLLYSNVLQISAPEFNTDTEFLKFDAKLVSESIVFAPLSRSALTAGLETAKPLITQLTLQLILYILKRLQAVLKTVTNIRQQLIDLVFNQLPDLNVIAQVLLKETDSKSKLIQLTALNIILKYQTLCPSNNVNNNVKKVVSNGISSIINTNDLSDITGYEITLLNLYIEIQNQEQDFKWWNKLGQSSNSFFTVLIKLASKSNLDKSFTLNIYQLLNRLGQDKMLFDSDLLISPILALIYSLDSAGVDDRIWNMLDESISRSIRTPYKYLDLSHLKYDDTSIFIVCLFEQFKFTLQAGNNKANIAWLFQFMRYLIIIGESKDALLELVKSLDIDVEKYESQLEFSRTLKEIELNDSSISEILLNYSINDIVKMSNTIEKKVIASDLDYLTGLLLLKMIISLSGTKSLIQILFQKFWNYLSSSGKNSQAVNYFTSKKCWGPLFAYPKSDNSQLTIDLYNEIIRQLPDADCQELSRFILGKYVDGKTDFVEFMWILNNDQLQQLLNVESSELFIKAVEYCIEREIHISFEHFEKLYELPIGNERNGLLIKLIESKLVDMTEEQLNLVIDKVVANQDNHFLIASFIKVSNTVGIKLLEASESIQDEYLNCLIAYSLSQCNLEIPQGFLEKVESIATRLLQDNNLGKLQWNQLLVILSMQESPSEDIVKQVFAFLDNHLGLKHSFIPEFVDFVSKCQLNDQIQSWLHKSMLYITKKFAESHELSDNFEQFIQNIMNFLIEKQVNIWNFVPSSILNTQLEVILNSKFNKQATYLKYVTSIVIISPKNKLEYQRVFQIALNVSNLNDLPTEENKESRYYSAMILYLIYNMDHSKLSTMMNLELLLEKYLGSTRMEDLLLKSILIKIESKIAVSWLTKVSNWEFSEELAGSEVELVGEQDRLIKTNKGEFTICLNKGFVKNTYTAIQNSLPEFGSDAKTKWNQIKECYQSSSLGSGKYSSTAYDAEFLLLLILNNEELLKITKDEESGVQKVIFNIKNLIETGILQFIIGNLSNNKTRPISKLIISKILSSMDDESGFKDVNVYKVYLSSVLFTLSQEDLEIPPVIWYLWSQFVPLLSNPGHFLYEKSVRYVLSTPKLKNWDIPLYNLITHPNQELTDTESNYYRELDWLVQNITDGIENLQDLTILKRGIVETLMNLLNSKYLNIKIQTNLLKFIYKIQSIDQGSDMLITRFGMLTALETFLLKLKETNDDDDLIDKQLRLNVDELLVRFKVSVGSSKRVREWTSDDLDNTIKRIHLETQ
ncbi:uncharacterized protein J8A68_004120 [[Candida] subhashii]|uniref:Nucleolar pre-ribosomal-associated protein 1 n=1 Tax=[Candida] subhashii TaxID=561895 RepID=A0A8J5QHX3_9ASCO|nr:uncharacterized protein J8A68_004120 [[Candida] subhashii]KAG7662349.1 hypothetical protein J8A68_004120 [[Candida] subhashii]